MENFLFTSRKVGVRSKPPRNSRMGMVSPLEGEPSMICVETKNVSHQLFDAFPSRTNLSPVRPPARLPLPRAPHVRPLNCY